MKSNNRHLAGGEKQYKHLLRSCFCIRDQKSTPNLDVFDPLHASLCCRGIQTCLFLQCSLHVCCQYVDIYAILSMLCYQQWYVHSTIARTLYFEMLLLFEHHEL